MPWYSAIFPLIFQSLCAENFLCTTFCQDSSVSGTTCIKYVLTSHFRLFRKSGTTDRIAAKDSYNIRQKIKMCKNVFERNIYVCSKFSSVRSSHSVCERAQFRGSIAS